MRLTVLARLARLATEGAWMACALVFGLVARGQVAAAGHGPAERSASH